MFIVSLNRILDGNKILKPIFLRPNFPGNSASFKINYHFVELTAYK